MVADIRQMYISIYRAHISTLTQLGVHLNHLPSCNEIEPNTERTMISLYLFPNEIIYVKISLLQNFLLHHFCIDYRQEELSCNILLTAYL